MNRKILILATALLLPLTASACPEQGGGDVPYGHRLERLNTELQLSPEQKTKMETIFKEQHEKFRAIHEESHKRIKEVLTPEQVKKWEQMNEEHQEKHKEMMEQHKQQKP